MTAREYHDLLDRAAHLEAQEQLRLLADLAVIVRNKASGRKRRSILELKGLGKEVWQGVEAQAYVEKERASWNG